MVAIATTQGTDYRAGFDPRVHLRSVWSLRLVSMPFGPLAKLLCLQPPSQPPPPAPDALREAAIAAVGLVMGALVTLVLWFLSSPASSPEAAPQPAEEESPAKPARPALLSAETVLELLRERRSVTSKDYSGKSLPEEAVREIISATAGVSGVGRMSLTSVESRAAALGARRMPASS